MRCAGSTDSHRVRIRTCPCEGRGIGASFQRNSSPVNLPAGRAFKIHWRFLLSVMGCPPTHFAPLSASPSPSLSANRLLQTDLVAPVRPQLPPLHSCLARADLGR